MNVDSLTTLDAYIRDKFIPSWGDRQEDFVLPISNYGPSLWMIADGPNRENRMVNTEELMAWVSELAVEAYTARRAKHAIPEGK